MEIKVNKDEADFSRTVLGNPTIITKNAETNVIQNDGQTIVIGGLSRESASRSNTGTPFLEDIPGLGYLFKRKSSSDQMEELIIFITPHILKPKAAGSYALIMTIDELRELNFVPLEQNSTRLFLKRQNIILIDVLFLL